MSQMRRCSWRLSTPRRKDDFEYEIKLCLFARDWQRLGLSPADIARAQRLEASARHGQAGDRNQTSEAWDAVHSGEVVDLEHALSLVAKEAHARVARSNSGAFLMTSADELNATSAARSSMDDHGIDAAVLDGRLLAQLDEWELLQQSRRH